MSTDILFITGLGTKLLPAPPFSVPGALAAEMSAAAVLAAAAAAEAGGSVTDFQHLPASQHAHTSSFLQVPSARAPPA